MEFPEKYIVRGKFKLHSGQESGLMYDGNALLTNPLYRGYILKNIPLCAHYVGVATGGAIIAMLAAERHMGYGAEVSIVKDRQLKGERPLDEWLLIDDVTTTGNSLIEAIELVGTQPKEIIVAVDRRTDKSKLNIRSLFTI